MEVVGSAVERINDPLELITVMTSTLLRQNRVVRIVVPQVLIMICSEALSTSETKSFIPFELIERVSTRSW